MAALPPSPAKLAAGKAGDPKRAKPERNAESVEEFLWNVISINSDFEEISFVWAQMMGIGVHQWMILMAVKDLDRGGGVSVKHASEKLHADPSFVTSQSKGLEKHGFLRRMPSSEDARVVLMSLTDKAYKSIASLHDKRQSINESIFADLGDEGWDGLNEKLSALRERFRRAAKRLAAEL